MRYSRCRVTKRLEISSQAGNHQGSEPGVVMAWAADEPRPCHPKEQLRNMQSMVDGASDEDEDRERA